MIVQASVTSVIDTIYSAYYALYYSIYCGSSVIFTTDTLARPLLYEACDCGQSNLLLFLFSNTATHQKSINRRASTFNIKRSPDKLRAIDPLSQAWYNTEAPRSDGPSPSGKAPGFGPGIRGFESLRPSQAIIITSLLSAGNLFLSRLYLGCLSDHTPTRVLPILSISSSVFYFSDKSKLIGLQYFDPALKSNTLENTNYSDTPRRVWRRCDN